VELIYERCIYWHRNIIKHLSDWPSCNPLQYHHNQVRIYFELYKNNFLTGRTKQQGWEELVNNNSWTGVPDAAFFAFLWWKREIRGKQKTKRRTVLDVKIPGIPSLKVAKNETRQRAFGQWKKDDDLSSTALPLGKQAELFASGHFPIGKIWLTKSEGTQATGYSSRVVSLSTALTWLIVQAEKNNLFKSELKVKLNYF
jgi:hypothetical protein